MYACHRALMRSLKTLTRAEALAIQADQAGVADDLAKIWHEVMRVARSLPHAAPLPSATPRDCA